MPFSLADICALNGMGKKISNTARDRIYEGGTMAGFDPRCITYSGPVKGSVSGDSISLKAPKHSGGNGTYIRNSDDHVTFGQVNAGGFIVSDQFGGCDMTILKAPDGTLWGAHVYSSATCRAAVAAAAGGWSVVGTWSSAGYSAKHPGCSALFVFTLFEDGKAIMVTVGCGGFPLVSRHVGIAAVFDVS